MKRLFMPILAALLLVGCGKTETPPPKPQIAQLQQEMTAEKMEKIIVSPYAVEHYLGELGNGHDFSWAREFPAEYVMIHFCSAVVNHRDDPYNMEYVRQTFIDADVSIHYILDRDGKVYCYVPEDRAAWHAGKGTWLDDEKYTNKMNLYSIGIEVVGIGSQQDMSLYLSKAAYNALPKEYLGFTDAQYDSLKLLVEDICYRNGIALDRQHIIGHQEFSPKKNDPGQLFDWSRIVP